MLRCTLAVFLGLVTLPAAPARAETYVDVTAEAGLAYVQHVHNASPDCLLFELFCEPERMTGGGAVGDVDGDGLADLYVTRLEAHDLLFLNDGDGTFTEATAGSGLDAFVLDSNGAAFADVDLDGDLDLYLMGITGGRFHLFINDGSGTFTEEAVARGAAVDTGDNHYGWSVAVGDFDRDGYPDFYTGEWRPSGLAGDPSVSHSRLLQNRGAAQPGHFDDVTVAAGVAPESVYAEESWVFAPAFVDLDGDGWQDLALASDFGTSLVFWNDGDETFTEDTVAAGVGTDENGMGSTFGDYDGDGDLDWFVTSIFDPDDPCPSEPGCNWGATGNRLYQNEGNRQFSDATDTAGVRDGDWGWGAAFFDSDNDGDLDLVMTNGVDFPASQTTLDAPWENDPMRFWRNDGSGGHAEESAAVGLTDTGSGKGLLTWDYDDDGDLDLLVVNNPSGARLYRNDGGNANDWLRVRVVHEGTDTPVLGARVVLQLEAEGPTQLREIGADAHFLVSGEAVAHFGLGVSDPTNRVAEVRVTLPDGTTRARFSVLRNRTLVLSNAPRGCGLLGAEAVVAVALARAGQRARARRSRGLRRRVGA
ncbi:MAG: CRTAC1 family protein [Deltaproteobacteria bacterium]|nr:CRTAC1 family protein [Deltaproteobacteria bacterium]MBW2445384.1 CRTAC1 family protein [Deltaproteobacteria bacterium]